MISFARYVLKTKEKDFKAKKDKYTNDSRMKDQKSHLKNPMFKLV